MLMHKRIVLLGVVFTLLLTSCSSSEMGNGFPVVERSFISSVEINPWSIFALSPDGNTVIDAAFTQTDLITNEQSQMFEDTAGLTSYGSIGGSMGWSLDGRYLAATQVVFAPDSTILESPLVLIDTQTNTAKYYSGVFNGWSAVNSERFMASFYVPMNVSDGALVTDWETSDFRKVSVKGSDNYLWDANQNLPIAFITRTPAVNVDRTETGIHVLAISSNEKKPHTLNILPFYDETPLQRTVDWDFDPRGKYVLLTVWERYKMPNDGKDEINGENVVDTVLILVDWRAQKQFEFFRISSIDPEHVIAQLDGTAWSADGSTIFIARKDAPAIVLKIKYP